MGVADLTRPPVAGVLLDRDGTLNRAFVRDGVSHPPTHVAELEILPGVPEALDRLKRVGFKLVVMTNQPDVARGRLAHDDAERIHAALRERLPAVDGLLCCYHDDADGCDCRKPRPGMLHEASSSFGLDLARSFVIGDSWRDTEAGRRAGCTTIQLRGPALSTHGPVVPTYWADDLADAAELVLSLHVPR